MLFSLSAQVLGRERTTRAERDGFGTITVNTNRGPVQARSVNEAIRIARDDIGTFLRPAERPGHTLGPPRRGRGRAGGLRRVAAPTWPRRRRSAAAARQPDSGPLARRLRSALRACECPRHHPGVHKRAPAGGCIVSLGAQQVAEDPYIKGKNVEELFDDLGSVTQPGSMRHE